MSKKNCTILSANVDSVSQDVTQLFFRGSDINFIRASNGQEVLEILQKEHVDLVLTSIMLPRMSGIDLARAIRNPEIYSKFRNNSPYLPILALSAWNISAQLAIEMFKSGINEYLVIPVNKELLIQKVNSLLEANVEAKEILKK